MTGSRFLLVFAFFLVIQSTFGLVNVHLKPVTGNEVLELFPSEVGRLLTVVENDSNSLVEKVTLKWETGKGLTIVKGLEGFETAGSRTVTVNNLAPGARKQIELRVKPVSLKEEKPVVSVSYAPDSESFDYYAGTYVKVKESPLKINAVLSDKVIKPGGSGKVKLSLENVSQREIRIKKSELVLPTYFFCDANAALTNISLAPDQEIVNKFFEFQSEPSFIGRGKFLLRLVFEDDSGLHTIERDFSVEVRGVDYSLILLIGIVILLIVVVIYSKQSQKKKKEKKP